MQRTLLAALAILSLTGSNALTANETIPTADNVGGDKTPPSDESVAPKKKNQNSDSDVNGVKAKKEKRGPKGGFGMNLGTNDNPLQPAIEAANWLLTTYDTDGDGRLSPEERQAAVDDPAFLPGLAERAPRFAQHIERNDSSKKRHRAILRLTRLKTLADQHDNNSDGSLSDEERARLKQSLQATIRRRLANLPPEKFTAIDTDGDGELSDEELAAWRQKKAKRWQQRLNTEQPAQDN